MKIINIHKIITNDELFDIINAKLNSMFREQTLSDINFTIVNEGNFVEISQPELYEGFLFSITIKDQALWITRSEDYVDDVNSLTIESILNLLFEELAGDEGVSIELEG